MNRAALAAVVVAVLVVLVITVIFVLSVGGHDDSPQAPITTTTSSPLPNTGPFTGTYTAELGPATGFDGKPMDGMAATTESWATRSVCGSTGCVATALRVNGNTSLPPMVFDQVGDQWIAVSTTPSSCENGPADDFYVITLQPQPNGRLTGDLFVESGRGCYSKRTVTFTRTGDTEVASLPDPAALPPRVVSPAEALHGQYGEDLVFADGSTPQHYDYGAQTYCLRGGGRCISYFHDSETQLPLVFENGAWTDTEEYDSPCPHGGTSHIKKDAKYPLPEPPQDPIARLTGHGFLDNSGTSCTSSDFDVTLVRTGD